MQILKSNEDASVNFVTKTEDGGFFESRFVQRSPHYFITYLSSHSGCNQSCRFCHLTASKQTMMQEASLEDFLSQAKQVLSYYTELRKNGAPAACRVNFNFMARGEPLLNKVVTKQSKLLFNSLSALAAPLGLAVQFNISTIIPNEFKGDLSDIFSDPRSLMYYSAYSMDDKFRKRWIPKARPAEMAFNEIARMQSNTGNPVAVHFALISGENDNESSVMEIVRAVQSRNLAVKFNFVHYNPFVADEKKYGLASDYQKMSSLMDVVKRELGGDGTSEFFNESRVVPRVGFDVKASCGMFVNT